MTLPSNKLDYIVLLSSFCDKAPLNKLRSLCRASLLRASPCSSRLPFPRLCTTTFKLTLSNLLQNYFSRFLFSIRTVRGETCSLQYRTKILFQYVKRNIYFLTFIELKNNYEIIKKWIWTFQSKSPKFSLITQDQTVFLLQIIAFPKWV